MARPQQLIVILSAFWITTQCLADYYSPANYDQYYQVPAYYQYSWEVKDLPSGNDYRQQETRDGHLTTGLYQVLLPGGRHQTVNYRVDKDSGFMADVSYQGENNYFTFKSNYQHQMSDGSQYSQPAITTTDAPAPPPPPPAYNYPNQPAAGPYNPSPYYPRQPAYSGYSHSAVQQKPEEQTYYYPSADQRPSYRNPAVPDYPTRNKYGFDDEPAFYPERTTTTTTAAPVKVTTTEVAVTTTVKAASAGQEEVEYGNKPDYSVPMYPLYRADFYSARAKSVKTVSEPQPSTVATSSSSGYGVDEEGYTYIKPSAKYSVPDRLGAGYEVNHRKATMRKPTYSDYQAPEALKI